MIRRWDGVRTAAEYLAEDRRLLDRGDAVVRCALLSDTSVSVGVAVDVPATLLEACRARGWPLLRRSTGGTGLLHRPGDLLWSVVIPRGDPRVGRGFIGAYGTYGSPIAQALRSAGVAAHWAPPLGLSDRFCLFGGRGQVLAVGDRALGGAAQHLSGRALLHHGVVGARVDRASVAELFDVPGPALRTRLTSVAECADGIDLAAVGRAALAQWAD